MILDTYILLIHFTEVAYLNPLTLVSFHKFSNGTIFIRTDFRLIEY